MWVQKHVYVRSCMQVLVIMTNCINMVLPLCKTDNLLKPCVPSIEATLCDDNKHTDSASFQSVKMLAWHYRMTLGSCWDGSGARNKCIQPAGAEIIREAVKQQEMALFITLCQKGSEHTLFYKHVKAYGCHYRKHRLVGGNGRIMVGFLPVINSLDSKCL